MSQPRDVALDHYSDRQRLVDAAGEATGQMWSQVDPARIADSWAAMLPDATTVVTAAQLGAARAADDYLDEALAAQEISTEAAAVVAPTAFAGVASDGRALASLLANPVITSLVSIQSGASVSTALASGQANLDMLVRTQVADAGRLADQVALTARRSTTGYVRITVGNSCSRCLILAGRTYRWSSGFLRHPRCDCIHLPTTIAQAGKLHQDPESIYARMSPADRTRAGFSRADQLAIQDGADLNQVVNSRRGLYTAGGRGFTHEGTSRRGTFGGYEMLPDGTLRRRAAAERGRAPRLSVDQIYRQAGTDREEALRLLRKNGYLRPDMGSRAGAVALPRPATVTAGRSSAPKPAGSSQPAHLNRRVPRLDELFNQMIKHPVGSAQYAEAADLVLQGIRGRYAGLDLSDVTLSRGVFARQFHLRGTILQDGTEVGTFTRTYERSARGKFVASHDYLALDSYVQGSGFQREFNGNLIDWYRRSDFARVEVHADIDVGGYTWASSGYDFANARTAREVARLSARKLDRFRFAPDDDLTGIFGGLPAAEARAQIAEMATMLDRLATGKFGAAGRPTAYEVSQLGRKPGMGKADMWIGKLIMLGSDWEGVLRL